MKAHEAVFAAIGVASISLLTFTPAAAATEIQRDSRTVSELAFAYSEEHPDDLTGLVSYVESLGGEVEVSSDLTDSKDPAVIEDLTEKFLEGGRTYSLDALGATTGPLVAARAGNLPADAFTVKTVNVKDAKAKTYSVIGQANWRDNFVGQGPPLDVATVSFSNKCGTLSGYNAKTWDMYAKPTNKASLRDAGVTTMSPTWNIDGRVSAFAATADMSSFYVTYNYSKCGTKSIQGQFKYVGNAGKDTSISVNAAWGLFGVSYGSSGVLELQRSTGAFTIQYHLASIDAPR